MKLRDLLSIIFCGILIWCCLFGLFQQKRLESYFNIFHRFDVAEDIKNIINKASVLQDRLFLIDKNVLKLIKDVAKDYSAENRLFYNLKNNKPITFALLYPTNSSQQVKNDQFLRMRYFKINDQPVLLPGTHPFSNFKSLGSWFLGRNHYKL